ncbi:MAG: hypothetical protein M3450_06385, partial [Actinomycetota bacterium]|nr:hypothetical protein [Actinomycetota bacterium]
PERREGLGKIASAIFSSLDAGAWSLPKLASGLGEATAGRHLLLWAADQSEQSAWQALGVDGSLRPDSLLVAVQNRGGNKLDQYLQVSAEVSVASAGDGSEVTVTLNLQNKAPRTSSVTSAQRRGRGRLRRDPDGQLPGRRHPSSTPLLRSEPTARPR